MKYSELVSFDPIENVIQIRDSDDKATALNLVKTFVISDRLAQVYTDLILPQLQFETPQDNKGILIIGNYGTGKSHFMSVISSVAEYPGIHNELNNDKAKTQSNIINGKFLVHRIEIGAVTKSLRDIVFSEIETFLKKHNVNFKFQSSSNVTSNKDDLEKMMGTIQETFPSKGFLLVIDEMLDYLKSRDSNSQILDLGFLRELGEFCRKSKFRLIIGLQQILFDNPSFSFAVETLKKVKDRFEQVPIIRDDIDYVIKHRLLNKTSSQKNMIRNHLEQFVKLYPDMFNRLEEYVELYPIHPSYTEILEDVTFIEKRHILKNISQEIKKLLDKEIPKDEHGLISYDSYWINISGDPFYQTDENVKRVITTFNIIENKINSVEKIYKDIAKRIIHGLCIHRLTTGDITNKIGLTSEDLRDGLCLIIKNLPQTDPDFLKTSIDSVLKKIHLSTDGSFISNNIENNQWYIDIQKIIDYDGKIKQAALTLPEYEKDQYFFEILQKLMEITITSHVTDMNIWQHQIMWNDHQIDREGYIFFGAPNQRSTAHPPRYFYIYFPQIFKEPDFVDDKKNDEVFFRFKDIPKDLFDQISYYAASRKLEKNASSSDKQMYQKHANEWQKKVITWIQENFPHHIQITYQGKSKRIEDFPIVKKSQIPFKNIVHDISLNCLSDYFEQKFPNYPKFPIPITKGESSNIEQYVKETRKCLATESQTRISDAICTGLQILDSGNKIDPSQSIYAKHILELLKNKSQNEVVNRDEIMTYEFESEYDKKYHLEPDFVALILASLAYNGDIVITFPAKKVKADNIQEINDLDYDDFIGFKNIVRPSGIPEKELVELFILLGLQSGLVKNEKTLEKAVSELQNKIHNIVQESTEISLEIEHGMFCWGEPIFNEMEINKFRESIDELRQFCDSLSKYDTVAKLKNLKFTSDEISTKKQIISEYEKIKIIKQPVTQLRPLTEYLVTANRNISSDSKLNQEIIQTRNKLLDSIRNNSINIQSTYQQLESFKKSYVDDYFAQHNKVRLNSKNQQKLIKILNSDIYKKNLALRNIAFLDLSEFNNESDILGKLKVCNELQKKDLEKSYQCICDFNPNLEKDDAEIILNNIDEKLEKIYQSGIKRLLETLQDPTVISAIKLLEPPKQTIISNFNSKKQESDISDNLIKAINEVTQGLEKVEIKINDLKLAIQSGGLPCTLDELKNRIEKYLDDITKSKTLSKVRFVVE